MSVEMNNETFYGTTVAPTVASTHLLETHDVTVKYNYTKEALHRTSLAFDAGTVTALIGPSGWRLFSWEPMTALS